MIKAPKFGAFFMFKRRALGISARLPPRLSDAANKSGGPQTAANVGS
jgi:hypothetical protein